MKESIRAFLVAAGYPVNDLGTRSEESVDYPDYAAAVARSVAEGHDDLGILVCGTGIGMAIAENNVRGVRSALSHSAMTAHMAREHNDANVLALGARVVTESESLAIVQEFLSVEFAGGRHQRRVEKITALDERACVADVDASNGRPDQ